MLSNKTKGVIAISSALIGLAALGYYFLVYKKDDSSDKSGINNFEDLKKNLGSAYTSVNDTVVVKFNLQRNLAKFYTNNRFVIFDNKGVEMFKGSYFDGGKSLNMDNGKVYSGASVLVNLENIFK